PKQITDALTLRADADLPADLVQRKEGQAPPEPQRLLTENLDLQLQAGLMLLQSRAVSKDLAHGK
ncbi:MAG: hypothetical protein ACT4PL_02330, partial [Phycisphaerales bacterium]